MKPGDVVFVKEPRRLFSKKSFDHPIESVLREQDRVVILGGVEHFSDCYKARVPGGYDCCLILAPCGAICYVAWVDGYIVFNH